MSSTGSTDSATTVELSVTGGGAAPDDDFVDMKAWENFSLPPPLLRALADEKFAAPTLIQELTLLPAMFGKTRFTFPFRICRRRRVRLFLGRRDILGAAETGSGKTLAFGLPILTGILKMKEKEGAEVDEGSDDEEGDGEYSEETGRWMSK